MGLLKPDSQELMEKAYENPGEAKEEKEKLLPWLNGGNKVNRKKAAKGLGYLAREYPEEIKDNISKIIDVLGNEEEKLSIRGSAILPLIYISEDYPKVLEPAIDSLISLLDSEEPQVRGNAARALGNAMKEFPEKVEPHIDEIFSLLHQESTGGFLSKDRSELVRSNAARGLGSIAKHYPDKISHKTDELIELLKSGEIYLEIDLIRPLAYIGTEEVKNKISNINESNIKENNKNVSAAKEVAFLSDEKIEKIREKIRQGEDDPQFLSNLEDKSDKKIITVTKRIITTYIELINQIRTLKDQELEKKVKKSEKKLKKLEQKHKNLKNDCKTANDLIIEYNIIDKHFFKPFMTVGAVDKKRPELNELATEMENKIKNLNKKLEDLKNDTNAQEKKKKKIISGLEKDQERIQSIKDDFADHKEEIEDSLDQEDLDRTQKLIQKVKSNELTKMEQTKSDYQDKLDQMKELSIDTNQTVKELNENNQEIKNYIENVTDRLKRYEDKLDQIKEIKNKMEQVKETQNQFKKIKSDLNEQKNKIKELIDQKEIIKAKKRIQKIKPEFKNDLEKLEEMKNNYNIIINKMKNKDIKTETEQKKVEKKRKQITKLLKNSKEKLNTFENNVKKTKSEILKSSLNIKKPTLVEGETTDLEVKVENPLSEKLRVRINFETEYFELPDDKEILFPVKPNMSLSRSINIKPKYSGKLPLKITKEYSAKTLEDYQEEEKLKLTVNKERKTPNKKEQEIQRGVRELEKSQRNSSESTFPQQLKGYYEEPEFIGKGGFAKVFKAKRNGEKVAVKIPLNIDYNSGKTFLNELKVWEKLEHPNIVKLKDYNPLPIPHFQMEWCGERSLKNSLNKNKLSTERITNIIMDVSSGLRHAHKQNILHQDLKPGNILLKHGTAKITDWGLSKIKDKTKSQRTGHTPFYAAPEQIEPKKYGETDQRTDIYQLGAVFYETLTGEKPFNSKTRTELYYNILHETPKKLSEINSKAEELDNIVLKCLSKNKEDRYDNIKQLEKDLSDYLEVELEKSLERSKSKNNLTKSQLYCGDLVKLNLQEENVNDAIKYAKDLKKYSQKFEKEIEDNIIYKLKNFYRDKNKKIDEEFLKDAEILLHKIKTE